MLRFRPGLLSEHELYRGLAAAVHARRRRLLDIGDDHPEISTSRLLPIDVWGAGRHPNILFLAVLETIQGVVPLGDPFGRPFDHPGHRVALVFVFVCQRASFGIHPPLLRLLLLRGRQGFISCGLGAVQDRREGVAQL